MKPSDRQIVCAIALVASMAPGCGLDQERSMVFTRPRSAEIRGDNKTATRPRRPPVKVPAPADDPLPPSNGIDVPAIDPR